MRTVKGALLAAVTIGGMVAGSPLAFADDHHGHRGGHGCGCDGRSEHVGYREYDRYRPGLLSGLLGGVGGLLHGVTGALPPLLHGLG